MFGKGKNENRNGAAGGKSASKKDKKYAVYKESPVSPSFRWKTADPAEKGKTRTLFGICGGCMQRDCATLVHLEDGVVTKIEGNPDCPPNYGNLCSRGQAAIMSLYNPYRVKTPLVRTNPEKGLDVDPEWKEVSWEEALSVIADKFKKVRDKDPRGLLMFEGFGDRDSIMMTPFSSAFGTTNVVGSHGPLCTIHYASMLVHAGVPEAVADMEHCEYLVSFGRSLGPNFATTGAVRRFTQAMDRGMKLVVFDPHCSIEASKGEWIPIRPGSDLACLLSMAHVMMHEGLKQDTWFLKNRTNAPYLINNDGNYQRDPATGKPKLYTINGTGILRDLGEIRLKTGGRISGIINDEVDDNHAANSVIYVQAVSYKNQQVQFMQNYVHDPNYLMYSDESKGFFDWERYYFGFTR